jgi:23S rRNA (uridine2552-2'-O)-methyltransferase
VISWAFFPVIPTHSGKNTAMTRKEIVTKTKNPIRITRISMAYNPKDHYFHKAKKENFVARSVFKLEEIDQKFKLLKSDQYVVDLGCSPGSWTQYVLKKNTKCQVIGIDLQNVTIKDPRFHFEQADIYAFDLAEYVKQKFGVDAVDLVLSDMAPRTTGIRSTDQARSFDLCMMALDVAKKYLKKNGNFVCKFFHSDDFSQLQQEMKKIFQKVEVLKPESTRKISKEIFLVGLNKKS